MTEKVVKVCGLKTKEAAEVAIENGASLLGMILVPGRARTIDDESAKEIVQLCAEKRSKKGSKIQTSTELIKHVKSLDIKGPEWFEAVSKCIVENGPFAVGVFRNQSLEDVLAKSRELNLDIVQLHGSENVDEFVNSLNVPIMPRFVLNKPGFENALTTHKFLMPLLDSEAGGEGKLIDWNDAATFGKDMKGRYLLAGGLNPENVVNALAVEGCCGVDVSGGVETDGIKDNCKIEAFIHNAIQSI